GPRQHGPHPAGEPWHLEQRERQPATRQLLLIPAVELTASGDCAHFIVELGPCDASAAVAETNEFSDVGGRLLGWAIAPHRSRGGRARPFGHGQVASINGWPAGLGSRLTPMSADGEDRRRRRSLDPFCDPAKGVCPPSYPQQFPQRRRPARW